MEFSLLYTLATELQAILCLFSGGKPFEQPLKKTRILRLGGWTKNGERWSSSAGRAAVL